MSSEEIAIRVSGLGKCFNTYDRPKDRLKQSLFGLAARLAPSAALRHHLQQRAQACARNFWALNDINFEVKKGETVGVIGRNGSGKSTLLQIICGTLTPTHGVVEVKGRVAALLELGSGFNPEYSGRENVYLNAQLLGLTREQVDQRFDDIAAFADIGDFIDQPVKAYSSGMYVRLAFAVIAHVDADVLVVDEALAVGDAFFTQKCMRFLRKFMKTGTVLFVSHDTASVKSLCTHAIWIEKGGMLETGSPKDVCDLYLQAFYEAQQGKGTTTQLRIAVKQSDMPIKDQRLEFLNASNLRNDIKLFAFDPHAASFGKGGAQITSVEFFDQLGHRLSWVVGGEAVNLRVSVAAYEPLQSPIIGFYIKDKLGQTLFGDNTYLMYHDKPVACSRGEQLEAEFFFVMPILPRGEYSVNVAIAEGTQEEHVQLHWIHDALLFKSESSSVSTGLVGIPMGSIRLNVHIESGANQDVANTNSGGEL